MRAASDAMALSAAQGSAGEVVHRLRGIDALGAGGFVNRERVITEEYAFLGRARDLGLGCPAAVAEDYRAAFFEALNAVDGKRFFLVNEVRD